jgi:hypothetical protein
MGDERTVRFMGGRVLDRAQAWRNMASLIGHWTIRGDEEVLIYGQESMKSWKKGC